jgi:MFS transporter, FHS family, Na+ dependent glucose transporter 1
LTSQTITTPRVRPLLATSAYYLAFIGLGLTATIGGPALPYLAHLTGSRLDQFSVTFVSGSLGYMLGSLLGGRMYDRFPGHRIIASMLLVIAATMVFVPIIPFLWLMTAVLFLLGTAQGALDVGCNTLLMWVHGSKVGPFMNGLHFFYGVGAFLLPIIVAQVLSTSGDIRLVYWLLAVLLPPIAIWMWRLPSPELRPAANQAVGAKVSVLPAALFVFFFLAYVGSEVGFGNWIYTYTTHLNLASDASAAYLTSVFWGSFTVGRLLGVGISTRLKSKTILSIDLPGCLAALAVIILWPASQAALWTGTVALGLFMASIFATALALAEEKLRLTGSITGWFLVGSGAGGMLLPWLIGQLFVRRGPQVTMVIIFVDVFVNLLILAAISGLSSRRSDPAG